MNPVLVLLLALSLSQTPDAKATAKQRFSLGTQLFERRDYPRALDAFEQSFAVLPLAVTAWNIGRCHEQLERWGAAVAWFQRYLWLEPAAKDRVAVEADLRRIERKLAPGVLVLSVAATPAEAAIALDGVRLGTGWTWLELTEGRHRLEVTLEGYEPSVQDVSIVGVGSRVLPVTLGLRLLPEPSAPPPVAADVPLIEVSPFPTMSPAPVAVVALPAPVKPVKVLRVTWVGVAVTAAAVVLASSFSIASAVDRGVLTDGTVRPGTENEVISAHLQRDHDVAVGSWVAAGALGAATLVSLVVESR